MEMTRYGSSASSPSQAGAVLRACAARHGLEVAAVSAADLAAAVIAADAWMLATGATTFDSPAHLGPGPVAALAAVLARAGGHGTPAEDCVAFTARGGRFSADVEVYAAWAVTHTGTEAAAVLRCAASDLAAGPGEALTAVSAQLSCVADNLE